VNLRVRAWLLLGAIRAIAATILGLVVHLAYEDDPTLLSAIEVHQYTAFASTTVFALTAWRWFSLQRSSSNVGVPGLTWRWSS
jgi:hypothetical protein